MTLNELKAEVAALGFDNGIDDTSAFIAAANRALSMICRDIPRLGTLCAPACTIPPAYRLDALHHSSGERIEFNLSGKAYSFYVAGKGEFTKITPAERVTCEFDTPISEYRGIIDGSLTLIFDGIGDYEVMDLLIYDKIIGENAEDIPPYERIRITPDRMTDDFIAFAELPRDGEGRIISGAYIDGREVVLPLGYNGVVSIRYERRPRKILQDTADIDIGPEAAHLLPLLTAYFVWINDEPDLAESYLELYRELAANEKRRGARSAEYSDVLRWA